MVELALPITILPASGIPSEVFNHSLSLRFDLGQMDPRITFTRASVASYFDKDGLLKFAANNVPRFSYHPITKVCRGLLFEEYRTNLLAYSEDASVLPSSNRVCLPNVAIAPDGSMTADKFVITTGSTVSWGAQTVSSTAGIFTYSAFLKDAGGTHANLYVFTTEHGDNWVRFNLVTGVVESVYGDIATAGSSSITPLDSGWYRCSFTFTTTGMSLFQVGPRHSGWTGDGIKGFYFWGRQLEKAAFPTSYIPTTTTSATRVMDVAVMTGTNFSDWYNQLEGTIVKVASMDVGMVMDVAEVNATKFATGANTITLRNVSNATLLSNAYLDGYIANPTAEVDFTGTPFIYGKSHKQALSYKLNAVNLSSDGGSIESDVGVTIPTATSLTLCATPRASYLQSLTYYPSKLDNTYLQLLSAA